MRAHSSVYTSYLTRLGLFAAGGAGALLATAAFDGGRTAAIADRPVTGLGAGGPGLSGAGNVQQATSDLIVASPKTAAGGPTKAVMGGGPELFKVFVQAADGGSNAFTSGEGCEAVTADQDDDSVDYSASLMTLMTRMMRGNIAEQTGDAPDFDALCCELRESLEPGSCSAAGDFAISLGSGGWAVGGGRSDGKKMDWAVRIQDLLREVEPPVKVLNATFTNAREVVHLNAYNDAGGGFVPGTASGGGGWDPELVPTTLALTLGVDNIETYRMSDADVPAAIASLVWQWVYPDKKLNGVLSTPDKTHPDADFSGVFENANERVLALALATNLRYHTPSLVWVTPPGGDAESEGVPVLITGFTVRGDKGFQDFRACAQATAWSVSDKCHGDFALRIDHIDTLTTSADQSSAPDSDVLTLKSLMRGTMLTDPSAADETGAVGLDPVLQAVMSDAMTYDISDVAVMTTGVGAH